MKYAELHVDDDTPVYGTTSLSAILECDVSDQIWVEASPDSKMWMGTHSTAFSGFLIHPF